MPILTISTNTSVDSSTSFYILQEATAAVARVLGKPESSMMVLLNDRVPILFGGSREAAAYGELVSIGAIAPDSNRKVSKALAGILESRLSVPPSRFYIKFYDVKGSNVGYNGSTY
ncbi:hypothetical protein SELMODRAFT_405585 [Selaginella moellendorffii]|uniref:L-dopachrome isomerase n=1 Tax=Selaginella moellendorffii TaxID=88036 RepID=D8QZ21_SELML|nr:macrophage migration inhibitory factor homolog [Selaginella moellendorffii]XP_002967917.1 macrophage migration inhibitory factor homolog [Selaginella moellendorffii]EFJ31264.1 hypothetical protein SELMODRAFT_408833 [Selaginella moellendorffii]EFJ34340.1 hypothetical protein SELMODRAFT_405585 [Selaginella moellendorffii]|eukprot:XP_002964007.1 macrophage migration inhibitory factor homolog [Selaginella moellendorffii]